MNTHDDMNAMLESAWARHYITGAEMVSLYRIVAGLPQRMAAYCATVREAREKHGVSARHWPLASEGGVQAWGVPINANAVRRIVRDAARYTAGV